MHDDRQIPSHTFTLARCLSGPEPESEPESVRAGEDHRPDRVNEAGDQRASAAVLYSPGVRRVQNLNQTPRCVAFDRGGDGASRVKFYYSTPVLLVPSYTVLDYKIGKEARSVFYIEYLYFAGQSPSKRRRCC